MQEGIDAFFTGTLGFILTVFLFIAGLIWLFTPFFILSIRDRLIRIQDLLEEQNENLPSRKRLDYEPRPKKEMLSKRDQIILAVIFGVIGLVIIIGLLIK
jgi:hypothetical protein